jgi:orotate phosphoribosyltransferase
VVASSRCRESPASKGAEINKNELARAIWEVSHLHGEFTLRSGRTANEYFDKYQFESDPDLLSRIAEGLVPLIPEGVEILAALELGGVPVGTAVSLATSIPLVLVRKEAKTYGTKKLAEGPAIHGRRLVVVEDVVTSGGQMVTSIRELRARGATVTDAVCVIDREEGGDEALAAIGVALRPLFTRTELQP